MTPADVQARSGAFRVLHAREPSESSGDLGQIEGAELVPVGGFPGVAAGWDRHKPLVMVCRSGARSGRATSLLANMGFAEVHNMVGGMMRWSNERRPTSR